MRIDVTTAGLVLTKDLQAEVRRRVLLWLSRYGREIEGVAARLAASRNPLGGVDQGCRIRARLHSGVVLRAEAMNGLIETAVSRSAERLALRVGEALDGRAPALRLGLARPRLAPAPVASPTATPRRSRRRR